MPTQHRLCRSHCGHEHQCKQEAFERAVRETCGRTSGILRTKSLVRVLASRSQSFPRRHRVVIVGCGFGGFIAAKTLRRAEVGVTVIDRTNHHLVQPLLHQLATGILSKGDIAPPIRDVLRHQRNTRVVLGQVIDVDLEGRRVTVDAIGQRSQIAYELFRHHMGESVRYSGTRFAGHKPGIRRSITLSNCAAGFSAHSRWLNLDNVPAVSQAAIQSGVHAAQTIILILARDRRREGRAPDGAARLADRLLVPGADALRHGTGRTARKNRARPGGDAADSAIRWSAAKRRHAQAVCCGLTQRLIRVGYPTLRPAILRER